MLYWEIYTAALVSSTIVADLRNGDALEVNGLRIAKVDPAGSHMAYHNTPPNFAYITLGIKLSLG